LFEEIVIAVSSYFKAHHFIVKNKLWKWILIPGLIYAVLFMAGIYFFLESTAFFIYYGMTQTGLKAWFQQGNIHWLKFGFFFGEAVLQIIMMLFFFSWF